MKHTWKAIVLAGMSTCTVITLASILSVTVAHFSDSGNSFSFRFQLQPESIEVETGVSSAPPEKGTD